MNIKSRGLTTERTINMSKLLKKVINLHLFDEGGANSSGNESAVNGSVAESNKPIVKYGKQADVGITSNQVEDDNNDREAEFEELINGKYKDLYEAKFKSALDKRFKNQKDAQSELDKYKSVMPRIAEKYKTENDIDSIIKALDDDDSIYEEEAMEKGIPVEVLKEMKQAQAENDELKRLQQEEQARKVFERWVQESEELKSKFPNFELETELQNPTFKALLSNPMFECSMEQAYISTHYNELLTSGMQTALQRGKQEAVDNILAQKGRPQENGVKTSSVGVITKTNPSQFNSNDLKEIRRRVQNGEKIIF